uniref:Uncharacterized protein n=1 Tax=viral metagenome TaxID=1070528 RepID=A0A6C0KJ66_9ZZZZ
MANTKSRRNIRSKRNLSKKNKSRKNRNSRRMKGGIFGIPDMGIYKSAQKMGILPTCCEQNKKIAQINKENNSNLPLHKCAEQCEI